MHAIGSSEVYATAEVEVYLIKLYNGVPLVASFLPFSVILNDLSLFCFIGS